MVTLVGQQFLHYLKDELIANFCKTPIFIIAFEKVIVSLLDAGQEYSMRKYKVPNTYPTNDLRELSKKFPSPEKTLGIDSSIKMTDQWWIPTMEKASCVVAATPFSDS